MNQFRWNWDSDFERLLFNAVKGAMTKKLYKKVDIKFGPAWRNLNHIHYRMRRGLNPINRGTGMNEINDMEEE